MYDIMVWLTAFAILWIGWSMLGSVWALIRFMLLDGLFNLYRRRQ